MTPPRDTPTQSAVENLPPAHRQVRTCSLCRQRRVKCDRQLPQCSNCLKADAACVYPPGRGRAPKRPRAGVVPQLSERLNRLESLLNQFGAAQQEHTAGHPGPPPADQEANDPDQSFDEDFSRLKIDESKSYYVNNVLWVTLSNEVEELRDLLFEPANEDAAGYEAEYSPSQSTATGYDTPHDARMGLNASIFGYRSTAFSLLPYHPSLAQSVALFATFAENVAPLVRVFHMPTLTRLYWDALASLESIDKHTEALLCAIHYAALVSLTPAQCLSVLDEPRETALQRYRFAVEQALARGDLLNTQSMTMLQAAVLFLTALPNEDDSRAAWSLTSLVYHIARTMGLHRDGTVFGLKPFETEMRRRLWWQICIIDSRSSEYHCSEPIARGFVAADVKPPLHVDDDDLAQDMAQEPAERWDRATDMTLTLVRCEAIETGWRLGRIKTTKPTKTMRMAKPGAAAGGHSPGDGDSDDSDAHDSLKRQRAVVVQRLEERLTTKYLPICDASVPFQLLSSAVARIILSRYWLITHYAAATRSDDPSSPGLPGLPAASLRDELFQTSINILEISGMLLTNKDIIQWTWYSKTHIQWGAMAFVLSELCTRPHSPDCDRAWECVTAVYEGWKVRENRDDETRLALWRPIRRLMAKARYVREMQRTDPARRVHPGGGGRPGRRPPVADTYPGMGGPWPRQGPSAQSSTPDPVPPEALSTPSESPALGLSTIPTGYDSPDTLQRVLGTETLGPFMDLLPDWPWADMDTDMALSLADLDST